MKRPLCLFSMIIAAAVFLYLEFFSDTLLADVAKSLDGSYTSICGTVSFRENRKDYMGNILPVLYLIPEVSSGNLKYVQCYMDSSDGYIPSIGEMVKIEGKIKIFAPPTNPGEFNSLLYYSTLKISYRITGAKVVAASGKKDHVKEYLCRIRLFFEKALDRSLNPDDSAVLKAVLLGDRAFMDEEVRNLYQQCGIIHILSVSGLHISILGTGLFELLRKLRVKRPVAGAVSIAFIYLYGTMCGMGTSPFRAILMFSLRMLAPILKRSYDILAALALAGILLLLSQPLYLYNSGFLFSFGAIMGIAYIKPSLVPAFFKKKFKMHFVTDTKEPVLRRLIGKTAESLLAAFSIFTVTLPAYAATCHTYPVFGFILNLIVVPMMMPLMVAGFICMLLSAVSPLLSFLPGILVHYILAAIMLFCKIAESTPGRTWHIGHTDHIRIVVYMVIILVFPVVTEKIRNYFLGGKRRLSFKQALVGEGLRYGSLIAAMIFLCFQIKPPVMITALDIGQGDAIVIEIGDKTMMIDGGSSSKKQVGKYTIIPFLEYEGIGSIDVAVMTHEDSDHISGLLEVMEDMENGGITVKNLMLPDIPENVMGDNYREIVERAGALGIPITYISQGKKFELPGTKAVFTCLNPGDGVAYQEANEYSTVLHMRYGKFTALFTGDVEGVGEENLKAAIDTAGGEYCDLTLLKVAHHGSEYTTDQEFLSMVRPRFAVISCGRDNSYGHPHKNLLSRLISSGTKIYRTDESGAVMFSTDGKALDIISYFAESDF